jgi:hypothetical protein
MLLSVDGIDRKQLAIAVVAGTKGAHVRCDFGTIVKRRMYDY